MRFRSSSSASMGLRSENPPVAVGSGKASTFPHKGACVGSNFRGVSRLPQLRCSPVRRDTGPPRRRVFVFLGLRFSESGAPNQARAARRRLSPPIRVNEGLSFGQPAAFSGVCRANQIRVSAHERHRHGQRVTSKPRTRLRMRISLLCSLSTLGGLH